MIDKMKTKPWELAERLRSAATRCTRHDADVALLCEHALRAAEWLEGEAEDLAGLAGSVTHNSLSGRITPGCVIWPNAEFTWRRRRSGATNGSASTLKQENER